MPASSRLSTGSWRCHDVGRFAVANQPQGALAMTGAPSGRLFSYWSGPISWMERLSFDSARALGCDVTVYSFDPTRLKREGLNCHVANAGEVVDTRFLADFRDVQPPHLTDHFRVEALAQRCGTWIDLDIVFLKQLPNMPYLFGWQSNKRICNAILKLPPDSALLADYLAVCREGRKRGIHHPPA